MTAQVIELASKDRLAVAWVDYQSMAARAIAEPRLLIDRAFFNEMTLRKAKYERLFLASERAE